jgi:glycosyltransferase involved in cell wall biosynthesis
VECSNEFLQDHSILIVPLLSGSGMKVKILEGMAKGMLVITTSCGIEGIPAKHLKNVLVADSTDRLAAMVLYAINNPEDAAKIRKEARSFVEDKCDMHLQAKRLDSFYRQKINSTQEIPEPIITFEP